MSFWNVEPEENNSLRELILPQDSDWMSTQYQDCFSYISKQKYPYNQIVNLN